MTWREADQGTGAKGAHHPEQADPFRSTLQHLRTGCSLVWLYVV